MGQALVANRNYLAKRRSNCNLFVLRISKSDDLLGMFTIEAYESITQIVAYARRFYHYDCHVVPIGYASTYF